MTWRNDFLNEKHQPLWKDEPHKKAGVTQVLLPSLSEVPDSWAKGCCFCGRVAPYTLRMGKVSTRQTGVVLC